MSSKAEVVKVTRLVDELQQGGREKANNVAQLLAYLKPERPESCVKLAINGLKLFFVESSHEGDLQQSKRLKSDAPISSASNDQAPEQVYQQWLSRQYIAYINALLALLTCSTVSGSVQVAAVVGVMEAVRSEGGVGVFSNDLYVRLLTVLTTSTATKSEMLTLLFTKYFHFADVRFFTLSAVKGISSSYSEGGALAADAEAVAVEGLTCNLFDVLSNLAETVDTSAAAGGCSLQRSWCGAAEVGAVSASQDKNERSKDRRKRKALEALQPSSTAVASEAAEQKVAWANVKTQRRMFSDAWIAFLRLQLPVDVLRKVLIRMPSNIIPNLANPLQLADFLTYTLNQGGMLGMLGLNGIFVLVTQHGLEYPKFYERLYCLLSKDVFAAKYRAQFFKLADIFLSSALVPAYTVASFAKRFARLGLTAPPAGALLAIAFIHNLIRRHPSCVVLLHRPSVEKGEGEGAAPSKPTSLGQDVFDENEQDPANTRAVESSLWEVKAFREHYCPQVSALASVLDKDITDRMRCNEIDIEPLLSASYGTIFTQEVDRRIKQAAVAFYQQVPTKLFDINCHEDFGGWKLC